MATLLALWTVSTTLPFSSIGGKVSGTWKSPRRYEPKLSRGALPGADWKRLESMRFDFSFSGRLQIKEHAVNRYSIRRECA